MTGTLLVRDALVFDGESAELTEASILIADGRIVELGTVSGSADRVIDAAGRVVGTTGPESITAGSGTATALIDLRAAGAVYGTFTFEVSGDLAVSDPDTLDSASALGQMITLQVAHLTGG